MTTNHTYAAHGLWSSLRTKHLCLFEFHPRHKEEKKTHQYKFITKEDQKTGIGENKKREREQIFTSYECVMLRKNKKIEIHIYIMKNIISMLPNYILMLRARKKMAQKWQRTERQREPLNIYIYIQRKWNKTITNILSECA